MTPRLSDLAEGEAVATGAVLASPHHSAAALSKAQARVRTLQSQLDLTRAQLQDALKELDEQAPRWRPLFTLTAPIATVSEANQRENHHKKAARVKRQREALTAALQRTIDPSPFRQRPRLRVTFTRLASVALDSDNLTTAFKACRDAVANWIGVDDGPRGPITWAYAQEPHKRHRNSPGILVTFEEPAPRRTP
jgi:hypothetical protein